MGVKNLFTVVAGAISMFVQSPSLTMTIGTIVPLTVLAGSVITACVPESGFVFPSTILIYAL